jgi:PKD repeat protein
MGGIFIPSEFTCDNGAPFAVNASNIADEDGTFKLLNSDGLAVAGLTDFGNNSAEVNPALLKGGTYTIEYRYFDGVVHILKKEFTVESVAVPVIQNLTEDFYCQNVTPFILKSDQEGARFDGPGVSSSNQGYLFEPSEAGPGNITIFCENVSEHGCTEGSEAAVEILAAPSTAFTLAASCIPESGGPVAFDNLTPEKLMVESWLWNFGDPGSGPGNVSSNVNPTHFYTIPGNKTISLTATTFEGCAQTFEMDTLVGAEPVADFTWISNCYLPEQAMAFVDRSRTDFGSMESFTWTFRSMDGSILDRIQTSSPDDTVGYIFEGVDSYSVGLTTVTNLGCTDSISKEVKLQPTVKLTDEGYREGFNEGDGLWTIHSDDGVASWVLNEPNFNGFDTITGNKAWYTQFPAGVIGYRENSWMQSPCYDFSDIKKGMIQVNIMRSFVPNLNGAVLQYRDVLEEGWKTVGSDSPGVNWYNLSDLINKPGGSSLGWGLEVFNPDHQWVRAAHALDELDGSSSVSFRIAIATTGAQGIGNQGFAFDDIYIGKRSKVALLEHFTNSSTESSRLADDLVDSLSMVHSDDILNLQYHTSFPGEDPMNDNNPIPAQIRTFYYGIQQAPYAVLDGGVSEEYRYPFSDLKAAPIMDYINLATLEVPQFEVDLSVNWMESSLEATTKVTCITDAYKENIQLYLAVFEREVTLYHGENGDTLFRNVVLDMLPTPSGRLLGSDWEYGDSDIRTNTWDYQPFVEDLSELGLAAFIQDRFTGQIIQVAVRHKEWGVGMEEVREVATLHVYPNPAKNELYVNLGKASESTGLLRMLDMNGREIMAEQIPAGSQIHRLDIGHLTRGIYILYWFEGEQFIGLSKIVKTE